MESEFERGEWYWDDDDNMLKFRSFIKQKVSSFQMGGKRRRVVKIMIFKDTLDNTQKIRFRRNIQRKVPIYEPAFVTLQDIKDVVLYLARPRDLYLELIMYFHIPEMDRFLRSLIIYFQYFIQIWENMLIRRDLFKNKLWQPALAEENTVINENLSQLRTLAGREYRSLVIGVAKARKFHHLNKTIFSLTEKDMILHEQASQIIVRIIWVALRRRNLHIIEMEYNRLIRSTAYNYVLRKDYAADFWTTKEEDCVLQEKLNPLLTKLFNTSPLITDLMDESSIDYRTYMVGLRKIEPPSDRSVYLEKLYAAPENLLLGLGMTVGILGIPRDEFDCIYMPRERTSKNFDKIPISTMQINIPPKVSITDDAVPHEFPKEICPFKKTPEYKENQIARQKQCRVWRTYLCF